MAEKQQPRSELTHNLLTICCSIRFEDVLFTNFKEQIDEYFTEADYEWLKSILRREMEVEEDGKLYKYNYNCEWFSGKTEV